MPISKSRISSPLEAGSSLLDATQLPPQLTAALEYVSERLARKGLHLSLVVVRKDVQMPAVPSPPQSPTRECASTPSPTHSPTRSLFNVAASNITKVLNRHSSRASPDSEASSTVSKTSSVGTPSRPSSRASLSRTKWGSLPASPRDRSAFPPSSSLNVSSCSSAFSSPSSSPEPNMVVQGRNPFGITLMHASTLTPKAEKILRHVVGRAERKFGIGAGYLPPPSRIMKNDPTHDLIQRSLLQNSILFTSTGLTLLALDHLYTFKYHLHIYSRSLASVDFTLAVDELRRLVLSRQQPPTNNTTPSTHSPSRTSPKWGDIPKGIGNKGRIIRVELINTYDWLGISLAALVDVDEGYKVAYGGPQRHGAIEGQSEVKKKLPPAPPPIETSFARRIMDLRKLKIRSSIAESTCSGDEDGDYGGSDREVLFGESAKGVELDGDGDGDVVKKKEKEKVVWDGIERLKMDRGPHRRGATTPNGFEDITPVTRGSWCYLMVGEGWKEGRRVQVETC